MGRCLEAMEQDREAKDLARVGVWAEGAVGGEEAVLG
jgi:hypothetical protein